MISDAELDLAIKREREFKKAMAKAYRQAIEREKEREKKWRKTKQGAFESSFLHLDFAAAENCENSPGWLADGGAGVKRLYNGLDGKFDGGCEYYPNRLKRLEAARKRIKREHPKWLEVFDLIIKNGKNRKESIWSMTSKRLKNGRLQKSDIGTT